MTWLAENAGEVVRLMGVHALLAVVPILVSLIVAVPVARFVVRRRLLRGTVVGATGVAYAIPSLPLLIVIPTLTGLPLRSPATLQVALTIYALALLIRGACDAFTAVPRSAREAAEAMGFSRWAMFTQVELPLAGPILLASLRVVVVSTVSLVTIGAVLGIESLGSLLTDGFQRGITAEVFSGIAATIVVALALDLVCVAAGRSLMPWRNAPRLEGR